MTPVTSPRGSQASPFRQIQWLRRLLAPRAEIFELDPKYFPKNTQTLIPIAIVLRHGMLPLGFKTVSRLTGSKKKLNVGFLDPFCETDIQALRACFNQDSDLRVNRFAIRVEQFLAVLKTQYGISSQDIQSMRDTDVHPDLRLALSQK
jgi:hypothetical protein